MVWAEIQRPFMLAVLGELRSGKSTLINALVGEQVALMDELETTATLNEYMYATRRGATIHLCDGRAQDCSIEEANALLDKRRHETDWLTSIDHVSFSTPSAFLATSTIWDAPGLFGFDHNTARASEFLSRPDAILWVFDANFLGDMRLREVLEKVGQLGKAVIGVINKAECLKADQIKKAVGFVRQTYSGVHFTDLIPLSALQAAQPSESRGSHTLGTDGGLPELVSASRQRYLLSVRD